MFYCLSSRGIICQVSLLLLTYLKPEQSTLTLYLHAQLPGAIHLTCCKLVYVEVRLVGFHRGQVWGVHPAIKSHIQDLVACK